MEENKENEKIEENGQKEERIAEIASNILITFWIYARTAGHQGHSLTHT